MRAEEVTEAWSSDATTCPKSPSKWAAKPKPASLTPLSRMETVIAGFFSHENQFSPDNRFHHSWNCRPGKKEDCLTVEANACPEGGYWAGFLPACLTHMLLPSVWLLTLSCQSSLSATRTAGPVRARTKSLFLDWAESELGRIRVDAELLRLP